MTGLREKLDGLAEERETLEARLEALADRERGLRELEALPSLVEDFLADLPHLLGREKTVREYETVPAERTEDNPLGVFTLTPDSIRSLSEEELEQKRLDAETTRAARFREIYAMIGLQAAVHPSGALDISLGANAGSERKGVMSWDKSSLPSTTSTPT
jgi:hypothetical protein